MRVFAVSDLHTDFKKNWLLLERIPAREYRNDALIVAGDIAEDLEIIKNTLSLIRSRFGRVFYTPGNHELWVRNTARDSIDKLFSITELCERLGVETRPGHVGGMWIVPLFSWYAADFDGGEAGELEGWADFIFCKWPSATGDLCEYFLKLNEAHITEYADPVISFSHFLPRRELLPPTRFLRFKGLPKVSGCASLDRQVRQLQSIVHVFGHTHINFDRVIGGVRYVQNALRYPRERSTTDFPMKMIADSSKPLVRLSDSADGDGVWRQYD